MFIFVVGHITGKAAAGEIVATIPAIASIVENITDEKTESVIGKSAGGCVHDYRLKPSDAMKTADAELIVAVDRDFEPFFAMIMKVKRPDAVIIELAKVKGMRLLPARDNGEHRHHDRKDAKKHGKEHNDDEHHEHNIDYHLWLDPDNAIRIAETVCDAASRLHPEKTDFYRHNLREFADKIKNLTAGAKILSAGKNKRRYMISHDNLQYPERFFNLQNAGVISDLENGEISIKKAIAVEKNIRENDISLLLIAGDVYPQSLNRLKKENAMEIKTVDVMGTSLPPGKDLYFKIMTDIIDAVCL